MKRKVNLFCVLFVFTYSRPPAWPKAAGGFDGLWIGIE